MQFRNPFQSFNTSFRFVEKGRREKKDSSYRFTCRKEEIKLFLSRYRQVFEEVGVIVQPRSLVSSNWNSLFEDWLFHNFVSERSFINRRHVLLEITLNNIPKFGSSKTPQCSRVNAKIFSPFLASFLSSKKKKRGKKRGNEDENEGWSSTRGEKFRGEATRHFNWRRGRIRQLDRFRVVKVEVAQSQLCGF